MGLSLLTLPQDAKVKENKLSLTKKIYSKICPKEIELYNSYLVRTLPLL